MRAELEFEARAVLVELRGRRIEGEARPPQAPVEALVGEGDIRGRDFRRQTEAASFPREAADLEDVREVGAEIEGERDRDRLRAVIVHDQALVAGGIPQAHAAEDVDGPAVDQAAIRERDVRVREVDGKRRVVVADRGTEQQRAPVGEAQPEARQVAGVAMVDAVDARHARARALDVAEAVEDRERVTVLQHARAVVDARRCREDVVAVGDPEDFVRIDHAGSLDWRERASLS